jgi:putative membrane protein
MLLEILIAITIGILAGIITGLTPGIHVNLISILLISISSALSAYLNPIAIAVIIISMALTHTFLDAIPSIFLGAPDSATALGVLPGHRYLLKGQGLMAVKLTLVGSFGAVILSILLFPLFIPVVRYGYPLIQGYIGYLLIAVVLFMVLRDRKKIMAMTVFLMSGTLGLIVLNIPNFENPLFPMLSGLFGISTLLISLFESQTIPEQKKLPKIMIKKSQTIKALFSGTFSGFITAVMPGLGASTAAIISMQVTRKLGDHGFMILMGAIGTVNFILSMVTLLVLGKARNGAIIAVQKILDPISPVLVLTFLSVVLITGSIAVFLTLRIGAIFSRLIAKVSYRMLVIGVMLFITLLVVIMTGFFGLLILATSTAVGIIPAKTKVTRTHAMGCLLLPVILYFVL